MGRIMNNKGFSLTEMIVVIAILAVVSSVSLISLKNIVNTNLDSGSKKLKEEIETARTNALTFKSCEITVYKENENLMCRIDTNKNGSINSKLTIICKRNPTVTIKYMSGNEYELGDSDIFTLKFDRSTGGFSSSVTTPLKEEGTITEITIKKGEKEVVLKLYVMTGAVEMIK